jgi:hypothetical protein
LSFTSGRIDVLVVVCTAPAAGRRRMPIHWLRQKFETMTWWSWLPPRQAQVPLPLSWSNSVT